MKAGVAAMVASTAVGLWLYVAPGVLGYGGAQETSDRIAGALVLSFSFVAVWEFMRGLRRANRPIAAWVALSVAIFQPPAEVIASTLASAAAIAALSFVRGTVARPYGGGWRALRRQREGS
jgi:hypothetical protein